jgi:hypothetical protein
VRGQFVDPYGSEPWCVWPPPRRRLDALERAIYSTIAYRDIFDFPPTIPEIHRYLHGVRCSHADVAGALSKGILEQHVDTDGTYFSLKGRSHLFRLRADRELRTQKLLAVAHGYARLLATLPNVRNVALTGSLAARNPAADSDIDFMLITDAGRLWVPRACAIVMTRIEARVGRGMLCPNFILTTEAIALKRRTLYDAQEIAQMIPLYGRETYEEFRGANRWSKSYLPNADGPPDWSPSLAKPLSIVKRPATWVSRSPIGRLLENFEADRKIRRLNTPGVLEGTWTSFTREITGVQSDFCDSVLAAWTRRIDALDSSENTIPEIVRPYIHARHAASARVG